MTSQSSDDPDDVTLGEEDQEELRDTLTGLAPTAQDPDEDEAYTPTQDEERSWQTFEQNPLRSMYGLADDNNNSSSNNNSTNGYIHPEKFVRQGYIPVDLSCPRITLDIPTENYTSTLRLWFII